MSPGIKIPSFPNILKMNHFRIMNIHDNVRKLGSAILPGNFYAHPIQVYIPKRRTLPPANAYTKSAYAYTAYMHEQIT